MDLLRTLAARDGGADTLSMTPDPVDCRRPTEFGRQAGLRWTLLLIVALIAVKAPALFRLGLWRDEAATYLYATASTPGAFLDLIGHVEANPPGFFYLMYQWVARVRQRSLRHEAAGVRVLTHTNLAYLRAGQKAPFAAHRALRRIHAGGSSGVDVHLARSPRVHAGSVSVHADHLCL
jgi:hypothetical protein